MSILIKGMEMPNSCYDCVMECNNICSCMGARVESADRHPSCPLIEVKPHGRLIDADALMKYKEDVSYKDEWHMTVTDSFVSVENIVHAPTIIEAEESEVKNGLS